MKIILMAKAKKAAPKKAATKKAVPKKSVAKTAVKKAVKAAKPKKEERTISIKYADKSAGQPELVVIFDAIKKMATPYHGKGEIIMHADTGGQFNLVSHKPVTIGGRERKELWFISALVQKGYVGFYYMPINSGTEIRKQFSPEFMKCLKGKGCFHIKKNDPSIMKEIQKAFKIGYEEYKKLGWI
jgi:hypothetical protein